MFWRPFCKLFNTWFCLPVLFRFCFFLERPPADVPEIGPEELMLVWNAWFWFWNRLWLCIWPPIRLMLLLWLCRVWNGAFLFEVLFDDFDWKWALLRSIFWFSRTCLCKFSIEWFYFCTFVDFLCPPSCLAAEVLAFLLPAIDSLWPSNIMLDFGRCRKAFLRAFYLFGSGWLI